MSTNWIQPAIDYYKIFFGDTADIVIDIGTRDGDDAFAIMTQLNSKDVYAVDARAEAANIAKMKYPNFNVFHTAISDFIGTTDFCAIDSDDEDYVGSSAISSYKFVRKEYQHNIIQVPVTTMDDFVEENNLAFKYLDFVKVDIEGYSWQFLQGFEKHINNVKFFHIETERQPTHENHRNSNIIKTFMYDKNFILVGTQYEWDKTIEDQIWVNKFLINNEKERLKWLKY